MCDGALMRKDGQEKKTWKDVLEYFASAYFRFIPDKEPEPKVDIAEKLHLA